MSFSTYTKQRDFSAESLKARAKPVLHGPMQRAAQAERRRSISEGQITALYHHQEKSAEEILADEIKKKERERLEKARAQIMEANKRAEMRKRNLDRFNNNNRILDDEPDEKPVLNRRNSAVSYAQYKKYADKYGRGSDGKPVDWKFEQMLEEANVEGNEQERKEIAEMMRKAATDFTAGRIRVNKCRSVAADRARSQAREKNSNLNALRRSSVPNIKYNAAPSVSQYNKKPPRAQSSLHSAARNMMASRGGLRRESADFGYMASSPSYSPPTSNNSSRPSSQESLSRSHSNPPANWLEQEEWL